jgi:hypothetical protein
MTPNRAATLCMMLLAFALHPRSSHAQARPTATREDHISIFGGATGTWTDLRPGLPSGLPSNSPAGKNLGVTVGGDFWWYSYRGFHPNIEIRGSYPIHDGTTDALKYGLAGVRIDHRYRNWLPYVDFLGGRGQIDYQHGGYPVGVISYISSPSNVYSFGGGTDLGIAEHLSLKADYQYQIWSSHVTVSGKQYPGVLTAGVVYHFGTSHPHSKHHYDLTPPPAPRPAPVAPAPPPPPAN